MFNLEIILLQTEDYLTFVGIGTLVAALAAVIGLIYSMWQERNTRFLEFLKDTDREISEQLQQQEKLEDLEQCLVYAYTYLDIMNRIAFLYTHNKIPKLFLDYYREYFNYGLTVMGWYTNVWEDKHDPTFAWGDMIKLFNDGKIEISPFHYEHMPDAMTNELSKDINEEKFFTKLGMYIPKLQEKNVFVRSQSSSERLSRK